MVEEGLANAFYFLMIISWKLKQLSLGLKVNVDSIPVLYCSYINKLGCYLFKIFCVKNFSGFHCPRNFFTNEIFPDYGIKIYVCNI